MFLPVIIYNLTQEKTLEKNISNSTLVIFEGSEHNIHLEKINEDSLKKLSEGWEQEKKGMYSLYTDILLLR